MKKAFFIFSLTMFTIITLADNIYLNESIMPNQVEVVASDMTEYMCYGDCEQYIGRYVYLVNSEKTNKSHFFTRNFKSENYIIYQDNYKLDKYRLFNYYSFTDFADKIYKVIDVKYIHPKKYYGSYDKDHFTELTLMDVGNQKNIFKYLNVGKFKECPNNPFVDVAFYKYHQIQLDTNTRYKIRSTFIKGATSNHNKWWYFNGIAYNESESCLVYTFRSDNNLLGYIPYEDVNRSFDASTVFVSSIIDESTWQNYCQEKGEKYAQCKLERKVIEGMSRADVQSIMGSPNAVLYNSRNIHDGWAIYAYSRGNTPQWIEFSENKVSCVDLYKKLWDKGDVYMIDIISHKLYNY